MGLDPTFLLVEPKLPDSPLCSFQVAHGYGLSPGADANSLRSCLSFRRS
jgi:hypothetical protein